MNGTDYERQRAAHEKLVAAQRESIERKQAELRSWSVEALILACLRELMAEKADREFLSWRCGNLSAPGFPQPPRKTQTEHLRDELSRRVEGHPGGTRDGSFSETFSETPE